MPDRILDLVFPVGGQDRALSYQAQRPFTTPNALNVIPRDVLEDRGRGGSRPGLGKAFASQLTVTGTVSGLPVHVAGTSTITSAGTEFTYEQIGAFFQFDTSGTRYEITGFTSTSVVTVQGDASGETSGDTFTIYGPVRMAEILRTAKAKNSGVWFDPCDAFLSSNYDSVDDAQPNFTAGKAFIANGTTKGQALKASAPVTQINFTETYTAEIKILFMPNDETDDDSNFVWLFARATDADPSDYATNALAVRVVVVKGSPSTVSFSILQNGTVINLAVRSVTSPTNYFSNSLLRLTVNPLVATMNFDGPLESIQLNASIGAHSSSKRRIGFAAECAVTSSLNIQLDNFRVAYGIASVAAPPDAMVVSSLGNVYVETEAGTLTEIGTYNGMKLAGDRLLSAIDYLGKLYIADYGLRVEATDNGGVVVAGVLDDIGITWDAHNIDIDGDVVELYDIVNGSNTLSSATLGGTSGYFGISVVHATNGLTLVDLSTEVAISTGACDSCNYRVIRGWKIYDPGTDSLDLYRATDAKGDAPHGNTLITLFQERITGAGDVRFTGAWFMSRSGDPLDWDNGQSDAAAATSSISANSETGGLAAPVRALIPTSEDYLLLCAASETFVMRGDPMLAGLLSVASHELGVIDSHAWARLGNDVVLGLTRDGLYQFSIGESFIPRPISRPRLPQELQNINADLVFAQMEYDPDMQAVYIILTPDTAGGVIHYWFDTIGAGFWPFAIPSDQDPTAMVYNPRTNLVLFGCRDGYVRKFDDAFTDDDGTAQTRLVDLGPFRLDSGRTGFADSVQVTLDESSDNVTWEFRKGASPEEAVEATNTVSATATAGVNRWRGIRRSGEWGILRLTTTVAGKWAFERARMRTKPGTTSRKFK